VFVVKQEEMEGVRFTFGISASCSDGGSCFLIPGIAFACLVISVFLISPLVLCL
jgi:hypothetical protein